MRPANWAPVTPSKWRFANGQVILAEAGVARPGPRRPFEYAVLTAGPVFSSVEITASVRLDEPVEITNRDVIIVFGYRSDTEFYYAHVSTDNTIYPHNGIFKVNNADRERIDYEWNGRSRGANPAIVDAKWHDVRVKHLPATGEIAVYLDGVHGAADDRVGQDLRLRPGRFRLVRQHRPDPVLQGGRDPGFMTGAGGGPRPAARPRLSRRSGCCPPGPGRTRRGP